MAPRFLLRGPAGPVRGYPEESRREADFLMPYIIVGSYCVCADYVRRLSCCLLRVPALSKPVQPQGKCPTRTAFAGLLSLPIRLLPNEVFRRSFGAPRGSCKALLVELAGIEPASSTSSHRRDYSNSVMRCSAIGGSWLASGRPSRGFRKAPQVQSARRFRI